MSDNLAQGFLEDITAHPDDDASRLIFADWLEEQGDSARAEFIRVQIERARLPRWDARQTRLLLREHELLGQHGQKWKAELPSIQGICWENFRRGFVATATFSDFSVLRANAKACWMAAPIEAISVCRHPRRPPIAKIAPIAGLRELSLLGGSINRRDIDRIADAPLLSTLRSLDLVNSMEAEGFRRLSASPHLGNLTALWAPLNSIGNGGVRALIDADFLTSLEKLNLSREYHYNRYGEDEAAGLEALASWPGETRLRSLWLMGNAVGRDGLRALLRSPFAIGLKELILRENGLNGLAMREFGTARPELQLDELDLSGNLVTDLGAAELASAPCLRELKLLRLASCRIQLSGARRLAEAPFLGGLRALNVIDNRFGPEGLRAILEQKPQKLYALYMAANELGDEGVKHLAESPGSDTLQVVNLARNGLGGRAAEVLAMSKHLRNLLDLRLDSNPIDKLAAVVLRDSTLGKRLARLEMPAD
ncbi:MAG TPA: TIGR02996 domain-containing protein [Gemmataceae bacterium]|jgi:uncharacterized protein (TIGR02996 family)